MSSGPGVRIALRIDSDDRIVDARFETVRFDAAGPVASALCEVMVGATIREVSRISGAAIARLARVPESDPAVRTVHFAKSASLTPFLGRQATAGADITCVCFSIPTADIRSVIARHHLTTVDQVKEHLPASSGCGTCRPEIEQLLAEGGD
jgi:bacterioferritin-associated ferredoxin